MDNKLQKIHDELVEKANELLEEAKKIKEGNKKFGRQRIKLDEHYYVISGEWVEYYCEDECDVDQELFEQWNYYLTREEAEKALARQKAIVKVNDAIDKLNEGWVPDWFNWNETKWNIYKDEFLQYHTVNTENTRMVPEIKYMKSSDVVEKIIKDYKKELNLIFNI